MLWTPRWLLRHAITATLIVAFLALGWWQVNRAASGNVLSYAYAIEWPVFAGFVVFVWFREVRQARTGAGSPPDRASPHPGPAPDRRRADATVPPVRSHRQTHDGAGYDDSDDPRLAAYNRYLAWLAAHPRARASDYRE